MCIVGRSPFQWTFQSFFRLSTGPETGFFERGEQIPSTEIDGKGDGATPVSLDALLFSGPSPGRLPVVPGSLFPGLLHYKLMSEMHPGLPEYRAVRRSHGIPVHSPKKNFFDIFYLLKMNR